MTKVIDIRCFDSPESFLDYRRTITYGHKYDTDRWAGNEREKECFDILSGVTSYQKNITSIEAILDKMQLDGLFTTGVKMPERYYFGSTPNITAYLHGLPKSMNRRVPNENSALNTPINIYLETIVSSGLSEAQIKNRGIACAALTLALQSMRPVNLYACNIARVRARNDNIYGTCVQLSSGTIDLSRVDFALTSKSYSRKIGHACIFDLAKAPDDGLPLINGYENLVREYLNLSEEDIYITSGHLYDNEMLNNPINWVRKMVEEKRYTFRALADN